MSTTPVKFSEHFGIDASKLAELGVFDPILNHDTKLFVDLLLLKDSKNVFMQEAFIAYKTFFANLMRLLKMSTRIGDRFWRAAKGMVHFEQQELWQLFWTEINRRRKHVKELYSQMFFYMVSSAWISGQDNKILVDHILLILMNIIHVQDVYMKKLVLNMSVTIIRQRVPLLEALAS